ncbi:MAG TPA: primosomal protein N' [Actinomycetales bacterium]|nr:primosomal protein N' [Actinomycetales bacterium]
MTEGPAQDDAAGEQLTLVPVAVRAAARKRTPRPPAPPAEVEPVAEVVVDVPLAHLDRVFEYLVPATMADDARPGVRVRVRFGGQDVDGFVVARKASADHEGRLAPLRRVVSSEVVLDGDLLALCRAVAARWGGPLADVLRLAVPPRHAEAEQQAADAHPAPTSAPPGPGPWARLPAGQALLDRLSAGHAVRGAWTALPAAGGDEDWPAAVAIAVQAAASAGRGSLVVVPDHRDLTRVDEALSRELGDGHHVVLSSDLGPRARYAAWLRVARGQVRVVAGTRAAMFAPVRDLGLVVCWDDGDDLHSEPRSPYPHVRDVLVLRAELSGAAALLGGYTRTAEVQQLVETGWARAIEVPGATLRPRAPRVLLAGEGHEQERDAAAASARLPSLAWRTAQQALRHGPVLVQVPRRGYVPAVACRTCRGPARCATCHGPLGLPAPDQPPVCRWCGRVAAGWRCPHCEGSTLRSTVVGARRTAEELGRAFPGVPVRTSGGATVLPGVPSQPAVVVATPGAEPVAAGGYAAALLLDAWALLDRADLRAGEEALRRWMNAAALVRGSADGGAVVLVAPGGLRPVEAFVRWAPAWFAAGELDERRALGFPPAATVVTLTGSSGAVQSLLHCSEVPAGVEVLGPVPHDEDVRVLLRTAPDEGDALVRALRAGTAVRTARKEPGSVRVQRDPLDLV